jgi:hypothetical protein
MLSRGIDNGGNRAAWLALQMRSEAQGVGSVKGLILVLTCLAGLALTALPQASMAKTQNGSCQRQPSKAKAAQCPELTRATRDAASIAAQNILRLKHNHRFSSRPTPPRPGLPMPRRQ